MNEIIAYPNPTSDKVYINLGEEKVTEKDVVIFDLFGKVCEVGYINASGATLEMDFSALEPGVYIIRLNLVDEMKTFRIIKD